MGISYAGAAQDTQLFVSKKLTVYTINRNTNKYELKSEHEGYTPLIYGKDYLQIGEDPRLKFNLYGKVVKEQVEFTESVTQQGFTKEGAKMSTTTTYGKQAKFIKVAVTLFDNMFVYDIKLSDEK